MRNYTPPEGSVLRPAGGVSASAPVGAELTSTGRHAPCGKRMIARRFLICSNHHRGSYTSPALAAASYPLCGLTARKFTINLFQRIVYHYIMDSMTNRNLRRNLNDCSSR